MRTSLRHTSFQYMRRQKGTCAYFEISEFSKARKEQPTRRERLYNQEILFVGLLFRIAMKLLWQLTPLCLRHMSTFQVFKSVIFDELLEDCHFNSRNIKASLAPLQVGTLKTSSRKSKIKHVFNLMAFYVYIRDGSSSCIRNFPVRFSYCFPYLIDSMIIF